MVQQLNIPDVVNDYSFRLSRFIRKRVNRIEDVEDILQDVFHQLVEADRLMKPIDEITAWLFTVTRNKITDAYRKKKPELIEGFYSLEEDDGTIELLSELLIETLDTPETEYLRSMVREEINLALAELPQEQRDVFEMTEFKGMTYKEISELTGEPINTLISRKRYAVLYLREELKILYEEIIHL